MFKTKKQKYYEAKFNIEDRIRYKMEELKVIATINDCYVLECNRGLKKKYMKIIVDKSAYKLI